MARDNPVMGSIPVVSEGNGMSVTDKIHKAIRLCKSYQHHDILTIRWECDDLAIYFNQGFIQIVEDMQEAYRIVYTYLLLGYKMIIVESEE